MIYGSSDEKVKTKLTDSDLINQFKAIEGMDEEDKAVIKKLIDAFITKKQNSKTSAVISTTTLTLGVGYLPRREQ